MPECVDCVRMCAVRGLDPDLHTLIREEEKCIV